MTIGNSEGKISFTAGESAFLASLADYQEEAVVSRILLKKDTGNITLFAFDQDQDISEHTAPFDAFVLVIEGRIAIMISESKNEVGCGETVILPAGKPHSLKALEKSKMLLVMLR